MVEGIDKREGRGTVEGSAVIQSSRDADGCLVDIGNTEINFSHDGDGPHNRGVSAVVFVNRVFQLVCQHGIFMLMTRQAAGACSNAGDESSVCCVFGMQMLIVLMSAGGADERDRTSRA